MFPEFPWKMTMEQQLRDNTKVIKLARKKRKLFFLVCSLLFVLTDYDRCVNFSYNTMLTTFLQLDLLLKDERERSAILNEKLQTAEAELSERLESIEALKLEMAKHKDVADKSKTLLVSITFSIQKVFGKLFLFNSECSIKHGFSLITSITTNNC